MPKCSKCGHTWVVKKAKAYKRKYHDHVLLTNDEHQKLVVKFGVKGANDRILNLDESLAIHGYKYASHYRVILKWAKAEPVRAPDYNQTLYKPKAKRRKDTPQEKEILNKMNALAKQPQVWKDSEAVKEIRALQKQYDELRSGPQKIGDILENNSQIRPS